MLNIIHRQICTGPCIHPRPLRGDSHRPSQRPGDTDVSIYGPFAKGAPGAAAPALPAAWMLSGILSPDSSQKEAAACQGGRAWQGLPGCSGCQAGEPRRGTSPGSSAGPGRAAGLDAHPCCGGAGLVLGCACLGSPFSTMNSPLDQGPARSPAVPALPRRGPCGAAASGWLFGEENNLGINPSGEQGR